MKKILILSTIIMSVSFINKAKSKNIIIPKDAIRLRIVANSNEEIDQKIKMKLSIEIEKEIQKLLKNTTNITDANRIINNNIDYLNLKTKTILKQENYNSDYKLTFGNTFFPEKKYNGVIYEQGYYNTLLITIGKGNGNNWWCVLFPPLCLMEADETETGQTEYKIFVKEILDKYL